MIGLPELVIIGLLLFFFLPPLIIALVVWKVIKGSNLNRISELESRVKFLERKLDKVAELIVQKDNALK